MKYLSRKPFFKSISSTALTCAVLLGIASATSIMVPRLASARINASDIFYTSFNCPRGYLCFNDYDSLDRGLVYRGKVYGSNRYWGSKYNPGNFRNGWANRADEFMVRGTSYNACLYDWPHYGRLLIQLDAGDFLRSNRQSARNRVASNRWTKRYDCPE